MTTIQPKQWPEITPQAQSGTTTTSSAIIGSEEGVGVVPLRENFTAPRDRFTPSEVPREERLN